MFIGFGSMFASLIFAPAGGRRQKPENLTAHGRIAYKPRRVGFLLFFFGGAALFCVGVLAWLVSVL